MNGISRFCQSLYNQPFVRFRIFNHVNSLKQNVRNSSNFRINSTLYQRIVSSRIGLLAVVGGTGLTLAYITSLVRKAATVFADDEGPLKYKPIRRIKSDSDGLGLKLTLFQYQTCPFCCKVRSYLDYNGLSYNVVEVNSVWRTQTKWTKYKKVPILVVHGVGEKGYLELHDSSVITSILETFVQDKVTSLDKIVNFYPPIETENKRGKTIVEYPNRYFIMAGDRKMSDKEMDRQKEERKWRAWTDDVLVHMLSPNIYRSISESLQAFHHFSEVGQWEKVFSTPERMVVIYVGAVVMYFIGRKLKKRHSLKDDVRISLYDACREWTRAVGNKHPYLGGDKPNMADLSVYGVMSAIEGCQAFDDLLNNTKMGSWYYRIQKIINNNRGHEVDEQRDILQNGIKQH